MCKDSHKNLLNNVTESELKIHTKLINTKEITVHHYVINYCTQNITKVTQKLS